MPDTPGFSIVVSYFNPSRNESVLATVTLCLDRLATHTNQQAEIIVADGSGIVSEDVQRQCDVRGWTYLPSENREPFASTYNRGMSCARGSHIALIASDIFVVEGWSEKLLSEMKRTGAWMAVPYLTDSDYRSQVYNWPIRMYTFRPSSMTFNLNILTRHCYQSVGALDERFLGCFNDLDYLLRIRAAGGEAIVVNAGAVVHLGRITTRAYKSDTHARDRCTFYEKYPEFGSCDTGWPNDFRSPRFSRSHLYRIFMKAIYVTRGKARRLLEEFATRLEPVFHRV